MEAALTFIPFRRRQPTGGVRIIDGREVLKVYKDPLFEDFTIYKTRLGRPSFWESDPAKVQKLIDAFKNGHKIENACFYAGITPDAWLRFNRAYPAFRSVMKACMAQTSFRAMNSLQESLPQKPELAFKYIEKRGDFNFESDEKEKPVQPTVAVVQINNNNNNDREIEERARAIASYLLPESAGEGAGESNDRVAQEVQG
jgi:hypothetical protein